jgi:hypothetical protein
MGMSITSGGMGKMELSRKDIKANQTFAAGLPAKDRVQS